MILRNKSLILTRMDFLNYYNIECFFIIVEKAMEELMKCNPKSYFFCFEGIQTFNQCEDVLVKRWVRNSESIIECIENTYHSIIIIAHSIDGRHLLNEQTLGQLSNCPSIRMACSFDNYSYPTICKIQRAFFQCLHKDRPYVQEILQIVEGQMGKQKQEEGLWYALSSVTQTFSIILQEKVLEIRDGLNFLDLFEVLSDEMIVTSKIPLKDNLKELMDHKIIIEKGGKYLAKYKYNPIVIVQTP